MLIKIVKKVFARVNNKRKQCEKKILRKFYRKAAYCKQKRDSVLLVDNLSESALAPMDNYSLFEFMMNMDNCPWNAYYLMNGKCSGAKEAKEKYGEHVILFYHRRSIKLVVQLYRILKRVSFICESFQALHWLDFGINEVAKASPHITMIFTQHGITFFKDTFIRPNVYGKKMFDKVMVSNEFEKKIFLKRGGYSEEDVIKNGLFRWDRIKNRSSEKNDIFIFFTQRFYLKDLEDVDSSVYVQTIKNFLCNPTFLEILKKNGLNIKIGLHHTLIEKFGYDLLKDVTIVADEDIERVKQEAKILITDYSAMCFEMMLQKKPVIFYRIPDGADCEKYQYKSDMPNPYAGKEHCISNIVNSMDEFLALFQEYVDNNFELREEEKEKNNAFFYHREDFCRRFLYTLGVLANEKRGVKVYSGKEVVEGLQLKFNKDQFQSLNYLISKMGEQGKAVLLEKIAGKKKKIANEQEYYKAIADITKRMDISTLLKAKVPETEKYILTCMKCNALVGEGSEDGGALFTEDMFDSLNLLLSALSDGDYSVILSHIIGGYEEVYDEEYKKALQNVLKSIDDSAIWKMKIKDYEKALIYYLKHGVLPENIAVQEEFFIDFITVKEDALVLEGSVRRYPYASASMSYVIKWNGNTYTPEKVERSQRSALLGHAVSYEEGFKFIIPLSKSETEYVLNVVKTDGVTFENLSNIKYRKFAPVSAKYRTSYYFSNGWILTAEKETLKLVLRNANWIDEARFCEELWNRNECGGRKAILVRMVCRFLLKFKKKEIWLFADDHNKAGGNAECLLEYFQNEVKGDVAKKYFVIDKKSADYNRLKKDYKVIPYLSYRHKILFLVADAIMVSSYEKLLRNPFNETSVMYRDFLQNSKKIFIPSQVLVNEDIGKYSRYETAFDQILCATEGECSELRKECYGYDENQIVLVGMCRFDKYENSSSGKNIITVAPVGIGYFAKELNWNKKKHTKFVKEEFKKSRYFSFYYQLALNQRLHKKLLDCGCELHFMNIGKEFPHLKCFEIVENVYIDKNKKDILEKTSLLVTDYSKFQFDYAYMRKPMVYVQFKKSDFGVYEDDAIFDCNHSQFGESEHTVEDVVDRILEYIDNDFAVKKAFSERMENMFIFTDKNNCERAAEMIVSKH